MYYYIPFFLRIPYASLICLRRNRARSNVHRPRGFEETGQAFGFKCETTMHDVGGVGIDNHGNALPDSTLSACQPRTPFFSALSAGLSGKTCHLRNNLKERPASTSKEILNYLPTYDPVIFSLCSADCHLCSDVARAGIDVLCVRELTGGIYFGQPKFTRNLPDGQAEALRYYDLSNQEIERITEVAVKAASLRNKKLCPWTRPMFLKHQFFEKNSY